MVDPSIIEIVKSYLRNLEHQGIPVEFGVIYGSLVKGQYSEWSDIDLLVISPRFDQERQRSDINLLWRIAARTDSRIEPIAVGVRQYEEDDSSAILEIARREGQIIPLAE